MKMKNKLFAILLLSAAFLSSCRLLELAVMGVGTDGRATQIPKEIDSIIARNSNDNEFRYYSIPKNSVVLIWQSPKEPIPEVKLFGEDIGEMIYDGVYTPKGYEIWRSEDGEDWGKCEIDILLLSEWNYSSFGSEFFRKDENHNEDEDEDYREVYHYIDETAKEKKPDDDETVKEKTYIYRVAAYNGAGPSKWTISKSVSVSVE